MGLPEPEGSQGQRDWVSKKIFNEACKLLSIENNTPEIEKDAGILSCSFPGLLTSLDHLNASPGSLSPLSCSPAAGPASGDTAFLHREYGPPCNPYLDNSTLKWA